jgi:hypothetical protein
MPGRPEFPPIKQRPIFAAFTLALSEANREADPLRLDGHGGRIQSNRESAQIPHRFYNWVPNAR